MNVNGIAFPGAALIGKIKSFDPLGPAHEIIGLVRQLGNDDWIRKVRRVTTGEEAGYRCTTVLDDPKAA